MTKTLETALANVRQMSDADLNICVESADKAARSFHRIHDAADHRKYSAAYRTFRAEVRRRRAA